MVGRRAAFKPTYWVDLRAADEAQTALTCATMPDEWDKLHGRDAIASGVYAALYGRSAPHIATELDTRSKRRQAVA